MPYFLKELIINSLKLIFCKHAQLPYLLSFCNPKNRNFVVRP